MTTPTNTDEPLFTPGEEVTLRGTITNDKDDDGQYRVNIFCGTEYLGTEDAAAMNQEIYVFPDALAWSEDLPLLRGDYVTLRGTEGEKVGHIVSVYKGTAWADWDPFHPDTAHLSALSLKALRHATPEEIEAARRG